MLIPKLNLLRKPKFRKWVAELPCMKCGREGYSQAAHLGKGGRGIKGCDLSCRPLCTIHPEGNSLALGCHEKFDRHIDKWTDDMVRCALDIPLYQHWQDKDRNEALIDFHWWRMQWI